MEYDSVAIGNRLYIARTNKNLKQIEIGLILNINQSQYSKIELGKSSISLPSLFKASEILEVSIEWLLGLNNNKKFTPAELLEIENFKNYVISKRK